MQYKLFKRIITLEKERKERLTKEPTAILILLGGGFFPFSFGYSFQERELQKVSTFI